jgi:ribonuclease D
LGELAGHPPKTQDDLGKVRGLSAGWRNNDIGARLMQALANAEPVGADELPQRDHKRPGLTKDSSLVSDLLKLLLKIRSRDTGVASKLIARSDELEALAGGVRDGLNMLKGWRFEEFGRDALDLVEGRLAFGIVDGKLVMTKTAKVPEESESIDA